MLIHLFARKQSLNSNNSVKVNLSEVVIRLFIASKSYVVGNI